MAIRNDLSHLPRDNSARGEPPDQTPRFGAVLAERWARQSTEAGERPLGSTAAIFRHSEAGTCARRLGYRAAGTEPSNPMDLSGSWSTGQGISLHDEWQQEMERIYGSAVTFEAVVVNDDPPSAGHIDALLDRTSWTTPGTIAMEVKTTGGYGYKMAVGARGAATGPKFTHRRQLFVNAAAADADEAVMIYLSREAMSPNELRKLLGRDPTPEDAALRFCAEWTYTRDQFAEEAEAEFARWRRVLEVIESGRLPAPVIPDPDVPAGARIVNPKATVDKGRWELVRDGSVVGYGNHWECGYCPYRDQCATDLAAEAAA